MGRAHFPSPPSLPVFPRAPAVHAPLTGTTVAYTQHNVTTGVLAIPGDLSTETQTLRGETNFTIPHMGAIFLNAGKKVYAPDGSEEFSAGPGGFDAYFSGDTSATQELCAALAAN